MAQEKICCEVKNVHLKVVERTSSKGNAYKAIVAVVNGREVDLGFFNVYSENSLLRAGVKLAD